MLKPKELMDKHLIAEYNEILMLFGHVRKYPTLRERPTRYCLGKGHINFFKDKLLYLKKGYELLKEEMIRRGFKPIKTIALSKFPKRLCNDGQPLPGDEKIIRKIINEKLKLSKYHYYGKII